MEHVIGGEFDFLNKVAGEKHNNLFDGSVLYSSGRAVWWQILNSLKREKSARHVLMPDYLCDSVYHVCDALDIPYTFYPIQADLSIDRDRLTALYGASGGGIILVVDYFGITNAEEDVRWIKTHLDGATVVLDNVQAPFEMSRSAMADYAFTSLRKAFPVPDGGVLKSRKSPISVKVEVSKFSQYKIAASYLKNLREDGYYDDSLYLELYERGEAMIDDDYERTASRYTAEAVGKLNVELYALLRQRNAEHIVKGLRSLGLSPCVEWREDKVPLFVPVVLEDRDKVRKAMFRNQIFCPVHWPVEEEKELDMKMGTYMANHELSIIVDHRYGISDMDRILTIIGDNL